MQKEAWRQMKRQVSTQVLLLYSQLKLELKMGQGVSTETEDKATHMDWLRLNKRITTAKHDKTVNEVR